MGNNVTITLRQQDAYQFVVDFGANVPQVLADEPASLGKGEGPSPIHFLLSAVANCLTVSLLFAMQKFKQDAGGLTATATCTVDRNEQNRLRVQRIDVTIQMGKLRSEVEHIERELAQFEDFCTVSQSVQSGIPIVVGVKDGSGEILH